MCYQCTSIIAYIDGVRLDMRCNDSIFFSFCRDRNSSGIFPLVAFGKIEPEIGSALFFTSIFKKILIFINRKKF